jgi:DNA polymerase III subunit gamma/tau
VKSIAAPPERDIVTVLKKGPAESPDPQLNRRSTETVSSTSAPSEERNKPVENGRENQMVHTKSVSIKGVLKGKPREIPLVEDEIDEADQVAEDNVKAEETVEITETDIQRVWKEYANSIERSHPRIFGTMNQQVPTMTGEGIIQITLNTNAQREYFVHSIKPELTRFFQKKLSNIEYVFETNLIENEIAAKKVYTDQDKLDFMIRKNPDLGKMKARFNLDFE